MSILNLGSLPKLARLLALQQWSKSLLARATRFEERARMHLAKEPDDEERQQLARTATHWRQECRIIDDWTHGRDGRPGIDGPKW